MLAGWLFAAGITEHTSRNMRFVTKPRRRHARRARGVVKKGGSSKDIDR